MELLFDVFKGNKNIVWLQLLKEYSIIMGDENFEDIIECQYENQEHYLFNYCPIIGLYFGAIIQKIRISTEMSNFSSIEIIILIHKICILSKIKIPSIQLFEKNVIICSIYQYKFGYICLVIICLDMSCWILWYKIEFIILGII